MANQAASQPAAPAKQAAAPQTLEELALEICAINGAAMDKAAAYIQVKAAEAKALRESAPAVVKALIAAGLIEPEESEKCAAALNNPLQTAELLKHAADFIVGEKTNGKLPSVEVGPDGRPAHQKEAGVNGHSRDWQKDADAAFDRAIFGGN